MTTLIAILGLFFFPMNVESNSIISDHVGTWDYEVVAPDMTYKGVMELKEEDGEYSGSLTSLGVTIPMTDVELDGDELTCKMNVQGFNCNVTMEFEGDSLSGTVSVEGMSLPLKGTRAK